MFGCHHRFDGPEFGLNKLWELVMDREAWPVEDLLRPWGLKELDTTELLN